MYIFTFYAHTNLFVFIPVYKLVHFYVLSLHYIQSHKEYSFFSSSFTFFIFYVFNEGEWICGAYVYMRYKWAFMEHKLFHFPLFPFWRWHIPISLEMPLDVMSSFACELGLDSIRVDSMVPLWESLSWIGYFLALASLGTHNVPS